MERLQDRAKQRQQFIYEGKVIYEWMQTLDEVNIFVKLPTPTVTKNDLTIQIQPHRIIVGLKNNPPYIDAELCSTVDVSESVWYLGETWMGCFIGHGTYDPFMEQEVKKKLMLERFQEEHPGFDFSNAEFSGNAPDPRMFMGGISQKVFHHINEDVFKMMKYGLT